MSKKHPEKTAIEKIVETQEESEEDDEITLRLFADGELVSWAKTLLYSFWKKYILRPQKGIKDMAENCLLT